MHRNPLEQQLLRTIEGKEEQSLSLETGTTLRRTLGLFRAMRVIWKKSITFLTTTSLGEAEREKIQGKEGEMSTSPVEMTMGMIDTEILGEEGTIEAQEEGTIEAQEEETIEAEAEAQVRNRLSERAMTIPLARVLQRAQRSVGEETDL